ncbi:MAG: hypothetical protein KGL38_14855 [Gemmatimonadota bacterium]|nr:hypothetical protein [Gemmatimonadota bacterium]
MSAPAAPRAGARHTVRLAGVVVGYSELEEAWPTEGRAGGAFRPGIGYELVEPIFRLFVEAVPVPGGAVNDDAKLERYHQSRDALHLRLEDADGTAVGTSAIHIADYARERGPEARRLEVLISDQAYWARRAARDGA